MNLKSTLILTFLCFLAAHSYAQERYLEEVFTDDEVTVTSNVHYATNATILALLFDPNIDEFIPEPLFMDVYEPDQAIDTATNRPVVIVVHGGDGLPAIANGACWGDKADTVTVNLSKKLARMGYVAVAPNYRLGWNPLTTSQDAFLDGLGDAAVRVEQDLKACARFLRKDVAEGDNAFNVHPDKIALWGTASTGGTYCLFAAYIEFEETQTPTWFVTDDSGNVFNIYNEMEAGNLDGTVIGTNALGDTTNYINNPNYSSDFQLVVAASGISLDAGTTDPGEPPLIMIGNPNSVVTQFDLGPIQLPTTGEVVAFVQLSGGVIKEAEAGGLNDAWKSAKLDDPYTVFQETAPRFGDVEGWFPTYGHPDNQYPFVWWDTINCPVSAGSFEILPGADRGKGLMQIDSMAGYFGPRACITLDLNCAGIVSTKEAVLDEALVSLSPNPANNFIRIEATGNRIIDQVVIYSVDGKEMRSYEVEGPVFQKDDLALAQGFYSVVIRFEDGIVAKKLIVR